MGRGFVGRFLRRTLFLSAGLLLFALSLAPAAAQDSAPAAELPAKVQELLQLLDDPAVRDWLAQHRAGAAPAPVPAETEMASPSGWFADRIAAIRAHVTGLA